MRLRRVENLSATYVTCSLQVSLDIPRNLTVVTEFTGCPLMKRGSTATASRGHLVNSTVTIFVADIVNSELAKNNDNLLRYNCT